MHFFSDFSFNKFRNICNLMRFAKSTYATKFGLGLRRRGAPELPVGQSSTTDALLFDSCSGPSALLCPLPLLQLLPELGCQPFLLAQEYIITRVSRALQTFPFNQFPVEFGAKLLPQRPIVLTRFRLTVIVAVVAGTCNGFILDAFAASSARICVYNEDFMQREKRIIKVRAR